MRILIVRNNSNSKAVDASLLLATYLATQGADYTLVDSSDLSCRGDHEGLNAALADGVEMAVVLGGDGTILRTARQIGTSGVPILGVNFGRLGFLANTSDEGVVAVVAAALAGDVVAEQRTNLRIDVVCEGEPDPWGDDDEAAAHDVDDPARTFFALNELAVTRGANGRIIDFSLGISGAHIADMRGDGLVVATATGSTAYALSAGGSRLQRPGGRAAGAAHPAFARYRDGGQRRGGDGPVAQPRSPRGRAVRRRRAALVRRAGEARLRQPRSRSHHAAALPA